MKPRAAACLAVIGLGFLTGPLAAGAQSHAPRLIAYLAGDTTPLSRKCTSTGTGAGAAEGERAFLEGLHSLGYRDGESVAIECRSAEGHYERLDALAAELVQLKPAVLVAAATPASLAAKRATSSIPIVSVYTADPVALGLVASLARPGANVTGISALASDYVAKSLQLLKEAAPRTSRVGVLGHAANPTWAIYKRELEPAGRALGIVLDFQSVQTVGEIDSAVAAMKRRRDVFRRAASLTDKILRGAKPADLPVEQPTSFQLAINLKTARSLGLTLPSPLLLRAHRIVE